MNKEQFNRLEIQQQVEYINKGLENNSLNNICDVIGISESTIRDRFKRKGYTRQGKEFIPTGATTAIKETTKVKTNKSNTEAKEKITSTKQQQKSNKSNDIKVLENRIDNLEAQIKGIMDIINTKELPKTTDSIKVYQGTTVTRSYKINEEVQQQFKLFCKKNNNHTISDIISSALDAFIKNSSNE